LLLFSIAIKLIWSGVMSILNLYSFKKASTRSLHFLKLVATQFLTYNFDKFSEKKNSENNKNSKNTFLIYLHRF